MKVSNRSIVIFLSVTFATILYGRDPSDPNLSRDERREIIRDQENIWNVEGGQTELLPNGVSPFLSLIPAVNQTVLLTEDRPARFTVNGALFQIPSESFPGYKEIVVELLQLNSPADYFLAGVKLESEVLGKPLLFQSTGMFHIRFRSISGSLLEPVRPIRLSLIPSIEDSATRLYDRNGNKWRERSVPAAGTIESIDPELIQEECFECPVIPPLYTSIDSSGWWNFDIPKPDFACIEGSLDREQKNLIINIVGIDYRGLSYSTSDGAGLFRINVLKKSQYQLIAYTIPEKGKSTFLAGSLPIQTSWDTTGFHNDLTSKCMKSESIPLKELPVTILKNRKVFLEALQISDI